MTIPLWPRPAVLGVLNVTPDSFSDGGEWLDPSRAILHALELRDQGATVIDIGGVSTRPGAPRVSAEEELRRVLPVIEGIHALDPTLPLSLDTTSAQVAELGLRRGVHIINDISGGTFEPEVLRVAAAHGAGLVLMHTPARPEAMLRYEGSIDPVAAVFEHLDRALERAIAAGVSAERIVLDPGFGFGKNRNDNLRVFRALPQMVDRWSRPVLVGLSRKRLLRELVGDDPSRLDRATHIAGALAVERGASVLRVHDVSGAADAARFIEALRTVTV
jgi:dihydropteroate synthase